MEAQWYPMENALDHNCALVFYSKNDILWFCKQEILLALIKVKIRQNKMTQAYNCLIYHEIPHL